MINEFIKNLQKNNIPYDDEKLTQLNIYYNFLIDYNSHTNVTAIISYFSPNLLKTSGCISP